MRLKFITAERNQRLILFFAGWGADYGMFSSLRRNGYDILLVYDYTTDAIDTGIFAGYDEIVIAAWSMGVFYADRFVKQHGSSLPITKMVAVNGTLTPIDSTHGIPEAIFLKTMRLPDRRSVDKFFMRICGGASAMKQMLASAPERSVDDLRQELESIYHKVNSEGNTDRDNSRWDEIFISESDLIFPPSNMLNAWGEGDRRVTILKGKAHLIDFQSLIDRVFVDKQLIGERFGNAADTYDSAAEAQKTVAAHTASALSSALPTHSGLNILEIGSGSGLLSKELERITDHSVITFRDLAPVEYPCLNGNTNRYCQCDAELALFADEPETYDAIVSSSAIQWFHSPRQSLKAIATALKPGGVAVISYFGHNTFNAIADIIGLRYPVVDSKLLDTTGCEYSVGEETIEVNFPSATAALANLRDTGVNSLSRKPGSVGQTREIMRRISNSDSTATLSYHAIYITLHKPKLQ